VTNLDSYIPINKEKIGLALDDARAAEFDH
jgi:hypothetical protein